MTRWKKTGHSLVAALGVLLAACGTDGGEQPQPVPGPGPGPDTPAAGFALRLGSGSMDYGKDVAVDAEGNVYVTGYFGGTVDFDPGAGVTELRGSPPADIFLAKYAPDGALRWARHIGGGQGADMPHTVVVAPGGDLLLLGYFTGTVDFDPLEGTTLLSSSGARDVFMARFDSAGRLLRAVGFGGSGDDEGMDLEVDAAGGVYVTALLTGTADVDPGPGVVAHTSLGTGDLFVARYTGDFAHVWSFRVGADGEDQGAGIDVDAAGNVYVSGSFQRTVDFDPGPGVRALTSAGVNDLVVAKYDGGGNHLWSQRAGGPGNDVMAPGGIDLDSEGRVLLTGRFAGTVDFDPGAGVASLRSEGVEDVFVARFREDGTYDLAFRLGSTALDGGHRVVVDAAGDMLVGGWFRGSVDFDPGEGSARVTAVGADGAADLFVAKYRADGALVWARTLGGQVAGDDAWSIVAGLAVDAQRNVLITGRLFGAADADPGEARQELVSAGGSDILLVKYTPGGELWRPAP